MRSGNLRQRFDHLVEAISLAVGVPIPRYRLWLRFHDHGCDPETITANMAVAFCDGPLKSFLAEEGLRIGNWARRQLRKEVMHYDPQVVRPEDRLGPLPE
jgi:hypothetical protein